MSTFVQFASERYESIKAQNPQLAGRRAILQKILKDYWGLDPSQRTGASSSPSSSAISDRDPWDFENEDDEVLSLKGLIIRTDFSNDEKWHTFVASVLKSETEGIEALVEEEAPPEPGSSNQEPQKEEESSDEEDEEDQEAGKGEGTANAIPKEGEDPSELSEAFIFIDPSAPESRYKELSPVLTNAANLTLLRLFSDVDVAPCRPRPLDKSKAPKGSPRLIDSHGLHEIYNGRFIWVYDSLSNSDECVRAITNRPTSYGTATGDSWRARASFIWELQINLSAKTMQIDFGGEDRYDGAERQRNIALL